MIISLSNVKKTYNKDEVLKDITFTVHKNDKIGLVGLNGCGKTTVLKIINNLEYLDDGEIFIRKNTKISYLDQIPVYQMLVKDLIDLSFSDFKKLENELKKVEEELKKDPTNLALMNKYGTMQNDFLRLGGYNIESQTKMILNGLKIPNHLLEQDFMTLSGGEKSRVILAKTLLEKPDLLLLDEPTNHLDIDSISFLESFLQNYEGAVIIISHDRYLLDKVCQKIINIENGKSKEYKGNYTAYLDLKSQYLNLLVKEYEAEQKKIKNLEDQIERFRLYARLGGGAKMYKKAKSRENQLSRIEKSDRPLGQRNITLDIKKAERTSKELIKFINFSKSYGDNLLVKNETFTIYSEDKAFLIGKNGTGKTSIFKSLMKETDYEGRIDIAKSAKIGYFQQEINYKDPNKTVLQELAYALDCNDFEARSKLAKFLFFGEDVFKKLSNLSGGEKAKLELCKIVNQDFNTLILDEPTNHLDIESKEALELALTDYKGTIFAISHDRYFTNKLATYIYELDGKELKRYDDNFDLVFDKPIIPKEKKVVETIQKPKTTLSNNKIKELTKELENIEKRMDELKLLINDELNSDSINFDNVKNYQDENDQLDIRYLELLEILEENNII